MPNIVGLDEVGNQLGTLKPSKKLCMVCSSCRVPRGAANKQALTMLPGAKLLLRGGCFEPHDDVTLFALARASTGRG